MSRINNMNKILGKYRSENQMLDYKLRYKTDNPVKIEKASAAYSSQLCSQHLGALVKEWQIKGLPPAAYQEDFRKAHVCPECYPVSAPVPPDMIPEENGSTVRVIPWERSKSSQNGLTGTITLHISSLD